MATTIKRAFLVLLAALSVVGMAFDIKSPQIRQWLFNGTWELAFKTPAKNYFVRFEDNSPALKVLVITENAPSRRGPKITDIVGHENPTTAQSVSLDCQFLASCLNDAARGQIKAAFNGMTAWEFLRLAYESRRFLSAAQIFFFEWPKDKETASSLARLWQEPIKSALANKKTNFYFEVLNASGEPGLALKVTRLLRQKNQNFDVLSFGNADLTAATSALCVREPNLSLAKRVLVSLNKIMGIELVQRVSLASSRGVDFSLILADNSRSLNAKLASLDFINEN